MADDEPEVPEDRPEVLPVHQSTVSKHEQRKRKALKKFIASQDGDFLKRALADPSGRRFLWGILEASGAFEERYGFGPFGAINQEATWAYRGQKDLGLRLYHTWSVVDRAGLLTLLDEFHPGFPKDK